MIDLWTFDPSEGLTFCVIAFVAQPLCVAWFLSTLAKVFHEHE